MEYLTLSELRGRLATELGDAALAAIIAEESAWISARLAVEPAELVSETFTAPGVAVTLVYWPDPAVALEVRDLDSGVVIPATAYWLDGRVLRSTAWPARVRVSYGIQDRQRLLAALRGVCLDLCRLSVDYMAGLASERLGDYTRTAADVARERRQVLARIQLLIPPAAAVAR